MAFIALKHEGACARGLRAINAMGLVGEYFIKKKFPNIMGLSYVHESPYIMGLSYVLSIMGLSYVHFVQRFPNNIMGLSYV